MTILEKSIKAGGQGASGLPTLLTRRSTIELAAGHADQAVADATRAVSLLQPYVENGGYSSKAGWAYLAEARALLALGRLEESRAAARSAREHLTKAVGADHADTHAALELEGKASPSQ